MTEDQLLTAVISLARLRGWRIYHVRNSRAGIVQGDIGYPDLTLVRYDRLVFAELKRESGRLTEAQSAWVEALGLTGAETYVWRPGNWVSGAIEKVLT